MTWQADPRPRIFSGRTWRRFAVGHSRMAVRRTRGHSRRELGASRVKQVEKLSDVSPAGYRYRRRVRGRRSGACRPPSSGWNCADRRVRSACATVAIFSAQACGGRLSNVIQSSQSALPAYTRRPSTLEYPCCPGPGGGCQGRARERRLILFQAAPRTSLVNHWNHAGQRADQATRAGGDSVLI
jgi:hypothetical protein